MKVGTTHIFISGEIFLFENNMNTREAMMKQTSPFLISQSKILIIEDDREIRLSLHLLLAQNGYLVSEASNGDEGLSLISPDTDLVILDIMMPGKSGFEVCQLIREKYTVPILFLSALGQEEDIVEGLSSGGDEYLVKPFAPNELIARVRAMIRRNRDYARQGSGEKQPYLRFRGICADQNRKRVTRDEAEVSLTDKEYQILLLLMRNPGHVFSINEIYEAVWQEPFLRASANTVMVHIRRLRAKLENNPQLPEIICTAWGRGYFFTNEDS